MRTKFVIAGTRAEADEWIWKDIERRKVLREVISMKDYIIVEDEYRLRGIQDPHGVFVGTWKNNPNIISILRQLIMCSPSGNKEIEKIWREMKPTPKTIRGKNYTSVFIDEAVEALSKAIDDEVMKNLNQKINGGALINVYVNGVLQNPLDYMVQQDMLTVTNPSSRDTDLTVHKLDGTPMYHQLILKPHATISLKL